MNRYSIEQFLNETEQKNRGEGLFEMEGPHMLEVNLEGRVWTKLGSMVAYQGQIKFSREGILEHGIGRMLKKAVSGEGASLTKAEGRGRLYLADQGKRITILRLDNESIYVNGNDLLAFEEGMKWDIKLMKRITGMMAGGLFNVKISGSGMIAITSHYEPMTLRVSPGSPVITDPNATVAWSGTLQPEFQTDISLRTFIGRGSGESIQLRFEGTGFVVVQPYEEVYYQSGGSSSV
ncbi:AIM24 family protein [Aneurinibacillus tyrosinisolvens]|uniref:AIM24 family protein n=1 Tax=Aneurinibacillus tyrosinisolvens TaxID=1443435 RepID=UPI00063F5AF2|nr:AIM24 family protein [Aneurinibacillus tyrosinisolvens]